MDVLGSTGWGGGTTTTDRDTSRTICNPQETAGNASLKAFLKIPEAYPPSLLGLSPIYRRQLTPLTFPKALANKSQWLRKQSWRGHSSSHTAAAREGRREELQHPQQTQEKREWGRGGFLDI